MTIPHRKKEKDFSLLIKIEHAISPYVAFGIMPLFAFANAGVSLEGLSLGSLLDKVPLGIVLGLFLGKQLGVFVFSYVAIKTKIAIITPDKDIIPDAQTLNPAYIVFENYEIILQWNRSLRFALAVCTLKDKFKNEI